MMKVQSVVLCSKNDAIACASMPRMCASMVGGEFGLMQHSDGLHL
jgi:hypothetical protein